MKDNIFHYAKHFRHCGELERLTRYLKPRELIHNVIKHLDNLKCVSTYCSFNCLRTFSKISLDFEYDYLLKVFSNFASGSITVLLHCRLLIICMNTAKFI